jgi:hypothetical protein
VRSSTSNSDAVDGAAAPGADDQQSDYWRRSTPPRAWAALALVAALITAGLVGAWEMYWRAQWHVGGDFKDSRGLWADQRRLATGEATVIIGSSRALFGLDMNVWEEAGHGRPIQLALPGTSPRMFLTDFAEDESFRGLLIVDVMSPAFFGRRGGRNEDVLPYYHRQTPSERIDHTLTLPIERVFAFIDEQTRPKRMLFLAPFPTRPGQPPRLDPHKLTSVDIDRNSELWTRVMEDEAYREEAKSIWTHLWQFSRAPNDEQLTALIAETRRDIERIRARGGEVVFIRMPYAGVYAAEDERFPRARFWDRLLRETNSIGIAWQDHPELQRYDPPDWSHLSPPDGERYTRDLARIMYARLAERGTETQSATSAR